MVSVDAGGSGVAVRRAVNTAQLVDRLPTAAARGPGQARVIAALVAARSLLVVDNIVGVVIEIVGGRRG